MRLNLTAPLHSRDGTLAKGAHMKNVVAEMKGDVLKARKRPGISMATELVEGGGGGQGVFGFGGGAVAIVDDVLYFDFDLLDFWNSLASYDIGAEVSYGGDRWAASAPVVGVPPDISGWYMNNDQTWVQL